MPNQRVAIGNLRATLTSVKLPMGLVLDSVEVVGDALTLDSEPMGLQMPKPGDVTVTLSDSHLAAYLEQTNPGGLHSFLVGVRDGLIEVHATKTVIIDIRAKALARLVIVDGRQLHIQLESVEVLGGGGLTNVVRQQVEAMNPLFDASELPVDLVLESVEASDGVVRIFGKLRPPAG